MPITHTNAKGKTYYLHQGTTKTGKPTYHFSMQSEGSLAASIPEGFEIYENPNAQVFLRKIPPKLITEEERQVVADELDRCVDLVGDARGELADGLELLRLAQVVLQAPAVGDVADVQHDAADGAVAA